MKKNDNSPYRSMGFGKIDAPKRKSQDSRKSSVIKAQNDLRCGGKK